MASNHRPRPRAAAAALAVVSYAVVSLFLDSSSTSPEYYRRSLLRADEEEQGPPGEQIKVPVVYPWARDHALPLTTPPGEGGPADGGKETALFWHIPKSGGSTAKTYYRCLDKVVDVESRPDDILRGAEKGLVPSGAVDIIFSSYPDMAIANLFDPDHKARVLAMFRHPVDRLVSKFYYLQIATWERTYRPEWKEMDVLEWVEEHNMDNDHMVKKLAGKLQRMTATEADLALAKRTIQQRFVVGLMTDMAESLRRFDVVMGVDHKTVKYHECRDTYFGERNKVRNSNKHAKLEKGDPAWDLLAEKNSFDMQLYEYVLELYKQQKDLIDSLEPSAEISALVA